MGRLKKILTRERLDEVRQVIDTTHYVEGPLKSGTPTRVEKLRKLGYNVQKIALRPGVSSPVGKIHHYERSLRLQIGSRSKWYAWCVVFAPLPYDKVRDYNLEIFHHITCI